MAERPINWPELTGQTVRVYRNLLNHKMSIQFKRPGIGWRVAGHTTNCIIRDVSFEVREAGRQRVIREQVKNVHAWGEGLLVNEFDEAIAASISLAYNPYGSGQFVQRGTSHTISRCRYLVVRDNEVFVSADALIAPVPQPAGRSVVQQFELFWQPQALCA